MNIRRNVVSTLYVVTAKIGDGKYQFRVQAESDTAAVQKAERQMELRFGEKQSYKLLSTERIEAGDDLQ